MLFIKQNVISSMVFSLSDFKTDLIPLHKGEGNELKNSYHQHLAHNYLGLAHLINVNTRLIVRDDE